VIPLVERDLSQLYDHRLLCKLDNTIQRNHLVQTTISDSMAGEQFERGIRDELRKETSYKCEKGTVIGESGNEWELDGIVYDNDGAVAFFEAKDTSATSQTYSTQMKRAYTIMSEFRNEDALGAVIVPEKQGTSRGKNWEALFESVDCLLIERQNLHDFILKIG